MKCVNSDRPGPTYERVKRQGDMQRRPVIVPEIREVSKVVILQLLAEPA